MTSAFCWQNSISLCPASFCTPQPNLPVTLGISWLPTFAFQSPIMKRTSFLGVSSRRSCKLLFTALDVTSITGHIHNWVLFLLCVSVSSFFLKLLLHWSPVAYWAPTNPGSSSFCVLCFCLLWGSLGKNNEVVCHSLLQWIMCCQNSPPWPICLGWPDTAWLIVSLS